MQDYKQLKTRLFRYCLNAIQQRIDTAQEAIDAATAAANEETKSSAGDKYETTRAMMHLEREKNEVQLAKALQLKQEMLAIGPDKVCEKGEAGGLVVTDQGVYYLAGGIGKIQLEESLYYSIALDAPIGALLKGKTPGDEFSFQGKTFRIELIY
ncbi:MAG: 3-oxoacyl-ACP synthase [Lewinellaceae bacterium]|nr:hypothetical protein [Saprospiraceae bacterium]MCB9337792.1 3-oxoacyl-ACP synthase [Lewinellaceae bacterium]